MTEKPNGWGRILLVVLPLSILGFVAVVRMSERVDGQQRAIDTKANRETVEVQYKEIMRRLDAIDRHLERINPR